MITIKLSMPEIGVIWLELMKANYSNGRLALQLIEVKSREPWLMITVNMVDDKLAKGEFFIKTWAENAHTTIALIQQTDLFENTGRIVPTGNANACVWKFKQKGTLGKIRDLGRS